MTDDHLLDRVEKFLKRHEKSMTPSRLGREAIGDPALVFQLRDKKRSLTLKTAEKVVSYMEGYTPPPEQAAA